jgi:hypothetical protein
MPPSDLDWSERVEGRDARFTLVPSRMGAVPVLVFAAVWDSFVVMLGTALGQMGKLGAGGATIVFLHAVVGVAATWMALARSLNQARLTLDSSEFTLKHSPIPTRGERASTSAIASFDASAAGKRTPWRVRMKTKDGRLVLLPLALESEAHARFVARRLDEALAVAQGRSVHAPDDEGR